jgi:hypothetical protein
MAFNPNELRDERGRWAAGMVDRLHKIMEAKGVPNARAEAVAHLQKSGVLHPGTETLTPLGVERSHMGPAERMKDRAARQLGRHRSEMKIVNGKARVK